MCIIVVFSRAIRARELCATITRLLRLINTQKQGAVRHPRLSQLCWSMHFLYTLTLRRRDLLQKEKIQGISQFTIGKRIRTNKAAKSKTDRFSKASLMLMFVQCTLYIVQVPTSLLISSPYEISRSRRCINNCAIRASPHGIA